MSKKYKAQVKLVEVLKTTKETDATPLGTHYIKVAWTCSHEWLYENWSEVTTEKPIWQSKIYMCNPVCKSGAKQSSMETTKSLLLDNFNYDGSAANIQDIIGYENELVVDDSGQYDRIDFVNNPSKVRRVIPKEDEESFSKIFDM